MTQNLSLKFEELSTDLISKPEDEKDEKKTTKKTPKSKPKNSKPLVNWAASPLIVKFTGLAAIGGFTAHYVYHATWCTQLMYSGPSIMLTGRNRDGSPKLIDDWREAYYWLRQNTKEDDQILSWWDYGYQIAGMANRTTVVDNNTWNNTHIARVENHPRRREKSINVELTNHSQ